MAIIRKSLKQLASRPPVSNRKLMKATSETATRRHAMEDGDDPSAPLPRYVLNVVRQARGKISD